MIIDQGINIEKNRRVTNFMPVYIINVDNKFIVPFQLIPNAFSHINRPAYHLSNDDGQYHNSDSVINLFLFRFPV